MAFTTLPLAGELPDATKLNALFTEVRPVSARKTANETVNNSTTLQNDDVLFVSVVANAVYEMDLVLHYNSSAVADIKIGWTAPAGATMVWGGVLFSTATILTLSGNNAVGTALAFGGLGADIYAHFKGVVIVSSTAGTLQLQWAQNTAEVSNTVVLAGSLLSLRRIS